MESSQKKREPVIVAGFRTPFMLSGQDFKNIREEDLGAMALKELLQRTPVRQIEELIVGGGAYGTKDLAHAIGKKVHLLPSTTTVTVQKGDLSSLESLIISAVKIQQGLADTIVAGGVDNMSQRPFLFRSNKIKELRHATTWKEKASLLCSFRPSDVDGPEGLPFFNGRQEPDWDLMFADFPVSREEQTAFVTSSFQKAGKAEREGKWKEEIAPIFPPLDFELKERDSTFACSSFMATPYLTKGLEDRVRAHCRALSADGAVFFLLMSREKAQALACSPLVSLYAFAYSGDLLPNEGLRPFIHKEGMAERVLSPIYATEKALKKAGLQVQDIGLFEVGESFSAQALTCLKNFASIGKKNPSSLKEIDLDKCNVNGGALALGDPLGATSARMVLSLLKEMKRREVEWGLATMGFYNSQAGALILKNEPS